MVEEEMDKESERGGGGEEELELENINCSRRYED